MLRKTKVTTDCYVTCKHFLKEQRETANDHQDLLILVTAFRSLQNIEGINISSLCKIGAATITPRVGSVSYLAMNFCNERNDQILVDAMFLSSLTLKYLSVTWNVSELKEWWLDWVDLDKYSIYARENDLYPGLLKDLAS